MSEWAMLCAFPCSLSKINHIITIKPSLNLYVAMGFTESIIISRYSCPVPANPISPFPPISRARRASVYFGNPGMMSFLGHEAADKEIEKPPE
jgi:hypothetical protein